MGDSGEGLVDAEARIQEQIEEREAERRRRSGGGPKIDPGKRNSVPDLEWSKHLHRRIGKAEFAEIVAEATPERMWKAGNIGGELLNWVVLLGMVGNDKPRYLAEHDQKDGHAYAVWRWD